MSFEKYTVLGVDINENLSRTQTYDRFNFYVNHFEIAHNNDNFWRGFTA